MFQKDEKVIRKDYNECFFSFPDTLAFVRYTV